MKRTMGLAWRYVLHHRLKSVLMIACIVLTTLMPIVLAILLSSFNRQIVARARSTPLVLGARGSRVDLTMHAIYFKTRAPGTIPLGVQNEVSDYGKAIPVHARISAQQIPVIGTTLDYFEFRNIGLSSGNGLVRLGDCVLGSRVARQLNLGPGDQLLTDRENLFDIAGRYPLKMRVGGVLEETKSPDDDAVFVDLKTAWVIEGFGHGHQDIDSEQDETFVMDRDGDSVTATAAVLPYTEITDDNIGSFHFHGSFDELPVTAMIVVPRDDKGEALLMGRFQRDDAEAQMSEPLGVVEELMSLVFRVQRFFNANAILISASTVLLLILVVLLSIRLRQGEMQTMFKIGCARGTMAALVASELLIVFTVAAVCVALAVMVTNGYADDLVRSLLAER